jgi:hypothetical protein
MSNPFRPFEYDASWYRIVYSRAAHRLHLASRSPTHRPKGPGEHTERILTEFFGPVSEERPTLLPPPEAAVRDAEELLAVVNQALSHAGQRWAGRSRAWYARLKPRRSPARAGEVAEFLDRVVEPAAVVLLLSARLELGQSEAIEEMLLDEVKRRRDGPPVVEPPLVDREQGPRRPRRRRQRQAVDSPDQAADDAWLMAYLRMLLTDERRQARPGVPARLLAALGVPRWRRLRPPSYRARYNVACLLSRLTSRRANARDREDASEFAREAAHQLRRCFNALPPGPRRDRLARWAWQDPGLEGLRDFDRNRFASVVGRQRPS